MKVAFRVDSSVEMGAGHLMRCLTLANALHADGASCDFVCRAHMGNIAEYVQRAGHRLQMLPFVPGDLGCPDGADENAWFEERWKKDAEETKRALASTHYDWLVVDHYALEARWEREMDQVSSRLMAIDDLANRPHACDLLLDQGLERAIADYAALIPPSARLLLGSEYALLRPEFRLLREYSMRRRARAELKRIIISIGGFDQNNDTGRVLDALASTGARSGLSVSVVMGRRSPHLESLYQQVDRHPLHCEVRVGVTDMAAMMAECDLAIGAAGGSAWERCALGVPSIVLVVAENQRANAAAIEAANAAIVLPPMGAWTAGDLMEALQRLSSMEVRAFYSKSAADLVDGHGADRVKAAMETMQ